LPVQWRQIKSLQPKCGITEWKNAEYFKRLGITAPRGSKMLKLDEEIDGSDLRAGTNQ
jgi:hypothetical protein